MLEQEGKQYTCFFMTNTFKSNTKLKLAKKIKKKLSNSLRLNFRETCPVKQVFCFSEIIWLTVMKMKMMQEKKIT